MTYRTLLISKHIEAFVNCETEDGQPYCHIVLREGADATDFVAKLKSAGLLIHDSKNDDPKVLDAKFKGHVFEESEFEPKAVVKAPKNGLIELIEEPEKK